jgi:putative salt-induced outer membrane protein
MKFSLQTSTLALGALLASTAFASAQSLNNDDPVNERVDEIMEDTQDKFALSNDAQRNANATALPGWRGSVFASADLSTGNTDTFDVSIGSRVSNRTGAYNQTFSFAYDFGEADGSETQNELFTLYDVNRSFTDALYGYGLARAENDFANDNRDLFVGFGAGYRIFNDAQTAWRVQAGPGYRISNISSGADIDEAGVSASSRFYHRFNEGMFLTNDTDIIFSDSNTLVSNDIGVNVSLNGPLSMRLGVKTDYNTDPAPGLDDTDTTTGLALVYTFN